MIWTYIKADRFFSDYCPQIKNYKNKIREKNGRGNPLKFTEQEMWEIKSGIDKLFKDLKKSTASHTSPPLTP
jgi:hypothetical protein